MDIEIIGADLFDDFGGEAQPTEPTLTVEVALLQSNRPVLTEKFRFTADEVEGLTEKQLEDHVLARANEWGWEQAQEVGAFGDISKLVGVKAKVEEPPAEEEPEE